MFFKIVPWLLVLSIAFAYAFPADEAETTEDPNHVHDEKCNHPVKEAFRKVKQSISNAYEKTKGTISDAFTNLKKKFQKPETTESPKKTDETTDGSFSPTSSSDSDAQVQPVDGNFGSQNGGGFVGNVGSGNDGDAPIVPVNDNSFINPTSTASTLSDSEIEKIINVRMKSNSPSPPKRV